jgi:TonB family protein
METYDSPGDSSLYYEYAYFADSFPGNQYAAAAESKLAVKPRLSIPDDDGRAQELQDSIPGEFSSGEFRSNPQDGDSVIDRYISPEEKAKIGPDGEAIFQVGHPPQRYDKQFIYPTAAYSDAFYGKLIFQVKIDAFGDVVDAKLTLPSPSEALNDEALETILSAHFETFWIPAELMDSWFWMEYDIQLPSVLR